MKTPLFLLSLFALPFASPAEETIPNPQIDYPAFVRIVQSSGPVREKNRLSEADFLKAMQSGEYVLLDARSKANFELRHISGAINLPFTEFTAETLAAVLPGKDTKILIYCNNNFDGSPRAMAVKSPPASLNLNTQASLRAYGYANIYELGPYLNVTQTVIPFEGREVEKKK